VAPPDATFHVGLLRTVRRGFVAFRIDVFVVVLESREEIMAIFAE
jgi:hypothetical protein